MEDPRAPIARYLREQRESAALTRVELGAKAGISPALIQKIEQGTRTPTLEALTALFDALAVPELFREHLLSLSLSHRYEPTAEAQVRPADRALIDGMRHPASLQRYPTYEILATNSAWRQWFPGLAPGISLLEWMFLDPRAKEVLVEWAPQVHMCLYGFRVMSPGTAPRKRIADIVARCEAAPEWAAMWATTPETVHDLDNQVAVLRDPVTGAVTRMTMHSLSATSRSRRDPTLVAFSPESASCP
ncbi:helix-turn-helix domain-containing protein [Nocardia camponoti]|uniref:HTH cro/C1-type domain-containing protein n=1 Tax=Nocardia camponoti TaxID=1616106 RepID=A0A917V817_9NOCA|nr:helix-turn-helix domain-containing protein [Nocardia camponoti]GGK47782.1 hypothetical protein GCM10011591_18890 [Nocardia camponoti]